MNLPFAAAETTGPTCYDIVDSPIGRLLLTGGDRALTGLWMLDTGGHPTAVRADWVRRPGGFNGAAEQLTEYFAGSRTEFDLALAPSGSPFQLAVWAELARIPYGVTVSYGEVATAIGKSLLASRAVGLANGRNPISIIVPCHRVIGADGSLTGYGGGLDRKEWLLRHEGAPFGVGVGGAGRRGRGAAADRAEQPTLF
jgi:methylated-DNA-[protein]-cysteine S-methyltransferase